MTAQPHQSRPAARRWATSLLTLCLAATAVLAATATPAQAAGSFCDTSTVTQTGAWPIINVIMPASGNIDYINCSMSRGATGPGVSALQQTLNRCYQANLKVDGQFGPMTEAALKQAQLRDGPYRVLGRYSDREAWSLRFMGIQGLRVVCARLEGPVLQ